MRFGERDYVGAHGRLSTPRVLASAAASICPCRNRPQDGRRELGATLICGRIAPRRRLRIRAGHGEP